MRTAFPFHKSRKYIFVFFLFFFGRIFYIFCKDNTPSGFENLFSTYFEFYFIHLSHHSSSRNLTIRIEHGNKTTGNQIVDTTLHIRQVLSVHSGRDNGMVICYLWIIKYFLRFRQCGTVQRSCQYFIITESFQNTRALRINIVTQESCIDTRIGGYFLFVKGLDKF